MSSSPTVDGALVQWGERLFYPPNRIVRSGPNHLSYQRAKLAMGVKAGSMHYRLRDIQARHWHGLAAAVSKDAWPRVLAFARNVDAALSEVEAELPDGFPSRVWTAIAAGMRRHVIAFLQAPL